MRLAQQLYEGIDIKGNGTVGVITYLRTDSTRISDEAQKAAQEYITEQYGEEYTKVTEKKIVIRRKFRMRMKQFVQPILQEPRFL